MKLKTNDIEDYLQNHEKLKKIYVAARKNITDQLYELDELEKTLYLPMRHTSDGSQSSRRASDTVGRIVASHEADKLRRERSSLTEQLKMYEGKIEMLNRVLNIFNGLAFVFPHHFEVLNRLWLNGEKVASARSEIGLGMTTINKMRTDMVRVIKCTANSELKISDISDIEKIKEAVNDDDLINGMRNIRR